MSNKKGEIATILTIGSLIFLGAVSIISSVFLKKPGKTQPRATSCSQISSVTFSPSSINAGQTFTCRLSGAIVNQYTMACGWSKNGGWLQGQQAGSCSGGRCTFTVKMEDSIDPNATYELVGFDFRDGCGPNTGKRVPLTVAGVNPQPTQPNCQGRCCDKPNGYIIEPHVRMDCDTEKGRYVIIDKVCQNSQESDKLGCVSCRSCGPGSQPISPVSSSDLAVNECTSGCGGQNQGICAGLSNCPNNITPAVIRSCADNTFSCPGGYSSCQKDGSIWCYGSSGGSSGGGYTGGQPPTLAPTQPKGTAPNPGIAAGPCKFSMEDCTTPAPTQPKGAAPTQPKGAAPTQPQGAAPEPGTLGGICKNLNREDLMFTGTCNSDLVCDPTSGKCTESTSNPTPIPTEPIPTIDPSENCVNAECPSPHRGILYSYKCINAQIGVCYQYNFYAAHGCNFYKGTYKVQQENNAPNPINEYCSAPVPDNRLLRKIKIDYSINQVGVIDINTNNRIITFDIQDPQRQSIYNQSFILGTHGFKVERSISQLTVGNYLGSYLSYETNVMGVCNGYGFCPLINTVPCGWVDIKDNYAKISCVLGQKQ